MVTGQVLMQTVEVDSVPKHVHQPKTARSGINFSMMTRTTRAIACAASLGEQTLDRRRTVSVVRDKCGHMLLLQWGLGSGLRGWGM